MDNRLKKDIEWAFMNYEANKKLGKGEIEDITERGLTDPRGLRGALSQGINRPTEDAALRLNECLKCYYWAKVIENVKTAFQFEIQGEIIDARFPVNKKDRLSFKQLVDRFGNRQETTYLYRYNKILDLAAEWAQHYGLIRIRRRFEFKRSVSDN